MDNQIKYDNKNVSEKEIKEEINYKLLYEHSGTLNCFFDVNGKLILYNKYFEDIFGNHLEYLKTHKGETIYKEYFSEHIKRIKRGVESGKVQTYVTHYVIDKKDVWFEGNYIPVKNDAGNILGIQIISQEISELKQTELKLQKSQEFLKKAQQLGQIGTWEWNLLTGRVKWSEETCLIYDIPIREYMNFNEIVPFHSKKEMDKVLLEIEESRKSKHAFTFESTIMVKGIPKYLYSHAEPIFDHLGNMTHLFGTVQDITDRIVSQKKIIESENRYRKLFEMLSDPVFLIDKETGNILEINSAVTKVYGYGREESLKMKNTDFSAEPDATQKALQEKAEKVLLRWHRKKDGSVFPVEIAGSNFNWKGDDVQIAVCRDITDRVEAENSLRYFERIFNLSANIIAITDYEGKLIKVNPAFQNILGYSPEEVEGKSLWNFIFPEDINPTIEYVNEQKVKMPNVLSYENRYVSKSGNIIWLSWKTQPIYDENISFSVAHDITHLKGIESQLIEAKEKAEESDRLKTAFLCNMSHEIRTPMNGIVGFVDILTQPDLSDSKRSYFANIINQSCSRLLNIINDIIDISKIETGQIDFNIEKVDIGEMLDSVFNFYLPLAQKKNLDLKLIKPEKTEIHYIKSDKLRTRQVLDNLLSNALKFTSEGGISFGYEPSVNFVKFFVRDTGIGIEKEYQSTVFERFVQADGNLARKNSGTGLGLPISKAFIENMCGKIWIEPKTEKGCVFYFTLPVQ